MPETSTNCVAPEHDRRRRLHLLRAAIFLQLCGLGVAFTFTTVWMKDNGLGEFMIGKISAAGTAVLLLASLLWGTLADRTRRPGVIAAGGCVGLALSMVLLALSSRAGQFLGVAVLRGIAHPAAWNMMPLLAMAALPAGSQGRGYGSYRIFGSLGYIVATLVLVRLVPDLRVLLMVAGAAMLLAAVPLLGCRARTPRGHHHVRLRQLASNPELLGLLAAVFFFAFANPAIFAFMPVYARRLGADNSFIGLMLALNGLVALVALPVSGRIVDRFGPRRMLWLAFLAQPLRVATVSLITDHRYLLLPQAFHFFTFAGLEIAAVLFITRLAGSARSGTAMSAYWSTHVLGGMLGVSLAGWMAERIGYAAMFRTCALAAACGLAAFTLVLLHIRTRERSAAAAVHTHGKD